MIEGDDQGSTFCGYSIILAILLNIHGIKKQGKSCT